MRYDFTVTIGGVDVSQWVKANGTIDYGVGSVFAGYQSPSAVFELFTKDENPYPAPSPWPTVTLGAAVIIHVTWDGVTQWRRFTGVVQALDYNLYSLRVTATGTGTSWASLLTGYTMLITGMPITIDTTIPDELETTRVQRWVGLAGASCTIEGVPARRVRGVPNQTTGQPLLDTVLRIAEDCDGLLMEDRLGVMHYRTLNFARPARWELPGHIIQSDTLDMVIERGYLFLCRARDVLQRAN